MKKFKAYISHLMMVLAVLLISCDNEVDGVRILEFDGTTDELLAERSDLSLFVEASERVGLSSRFTGSESFTFFAPDDDAFLVALKSGGFDRLSDADDDFIRTLLDNHTVSGAVTSGALTKTTITTIGNNPVEVSVEGGVILNAKSTVTDADNTTNNGVVHVVDFPLIDFASSTIAQVIAARAADTEAPEFTVLNAALIATGLDATLAGTSGEFTLFAPTDAAFGAIGIDVDAIAGIDVDDLTDILLLHVLNERNFTVDLASQRLYTALGPVNEAQGIDIDVSNSGIEFETGVGVTSNTTDANILATNGTIHEISSVLSTEPYLFESISGPFGLSVADGVLFGAYFGGLNAATFDFDSLLSREEEFTILAPRFITLAATEEELNDQLRGYIFEGALDISAVDDGGKITAINGDEYFVTEDVDGDLVINAGDSFLQLLGSGASAAEDVPVYNGLVTSFLFEFVPLPEETASEFVTVDSLSLFNSAIDFLDLGGLSGVTYLYVEDDVFVSAFEDAYGATDLTVDAAALIAADADGIAMALDSLEEDNIAVLSEIVNRHVVTSFFVSAALEEGSTFQDRNGVNVEFAQSPDAGVFGILTVNEGVVNFVEILQADILSNNAPIHLVDGIIPAPDEE